MRSNFAPVFTEGIVYFPQVNPSQHVLDLTDYACQELLVSFAVTNRAGLSNFSAPQMITIEGGKPYSISTWH